MKIVIQRVSRAAVTVDGETVASGDLMGAMREIKD